MDDIQCNMVNDISYSGGKKVQCYHKSNISITMYCLDIYHAHGINDLLMNVVMETTSQEL